VRGYAVSYRWMANIKMEVKEIGIDGMDWVHLTQNTNRWLAFVNTVMNLLVPHKRAIC
jgi:hypothetical protein